MSIVLIVYTLRVAAHALVCRGPRPGRCAGGKAIIVYSSLRESLPVGGGAGHSLRFAEAIDIVP